MQLISAMSYFSVGNGRSNFHAQSFVPLLPWRDIVGRCFCPDENSRKGQLGYSSRVNLFEPIYASCMDVRVGLWRKLSAEELMHLNCGVGEDSWESLELQEIQPVHSKGDQPWVFLGRNDAKAETPILWPPRAKSWLIGKDSDAGKGWGQEEKGTTEDEMAGWHHWLDGCESEWTLGVDDGQGGLACCDSQGREESDTTEQMNWAELNHQPSGSTQCRIYCAGQHVYISTWVRVSFSAEQLKDTCVRCIWDYVCPLRRDEDCFILELLFRLSLLFLLFCFSFVSVFSHFPNW